ncbi:MAG: hypothetical protein OEW62_03090 [Candidatus Bathyarchaeota archaeon]|nr:hypothetical protein [Candidatus Bathyarchaeota archaeon]MDH5746467.1 hypothetical protein [Candidatus Bathyarchaeota archaeon]
MADDLEGVKEQIIFSVLFAAAEIVAALVTFAYIILPKVTNLSQQEIISFIVCLATPLIGILIIVIIYLVLSQRIRHTKLNAKRIEESEPTKIKEDLAKKPEPIFFFDIPFDEVHFTTPKTKPQVVYFRNDSPECDLKSIFVYGQCSRREFLNLVHFRFKRKRRRHFSQDTGTIDNLIDVLGHDSREPVSVVFETPGPKCPYRPENASQNFECPSFKFGLYAKTSDERHFAHGKNITIYCKCPR